MLILTVILYVLAALVVGVCVLKNMFRSTLRASVHLGATALVVPLAYLITRRGVVNFGKQLAEFFASTDGENVMTGMPPVAASLPSAPDAIGAWASMLLPPLMFVFTFVALQIVACLIVFLVLNAVEKRAAQKASEADGAQDDVPAAPEKRTCSGKTRAIGAVLGLVSGLLIVVVCYLPLAGYSQYLPQLLETAETLTTLTAEPQTDDNAAFADAQKLAKTPVLAVPRALGGWLFDSMTRADMQGERVTLGDELDALSELADEISVLAAVPLSEYGDEQEQAMLRLADIVETSPILLAVGAEAAAGFSDAWLEDEAFLGVPRPDLGVGMNFALDAAMTVMKDTTKETFPGDIRALAPAFCAAIKTVYTIADISDSNSFSMEDLTTVMDVISQGTSSPETREALIRAGMGMLAKEFADLIAPTAPAPDEGGAQDDATADPPAPEQPSAGEDVVIDLPGEDDVTEEEYNNFVAALTDLVIAGVMTKDEATIVEEVKGLRDACGINISDEECEQLVKGALDSPFFSFFQ